MALINGSTFAFGVPISLVLNATHYRALANPPSVGVLLPALDRSVGSMKCSAIYLKEGNLLEMSGYYLAGRDVGLVVAPAAAVVVEALVGLHV